VHEGDVYAALGAEGFGPLVAAFYRQIPEDPILGPMYPEQDFVGAEERLRLFLRVRFGGPEDYLEQRGHPRLRMRHAPFAIDTRARDRWVQLMETALEEVEPPAEVAETLRPFFAQVATFLINRRDP